MRHEDEPGAEVFWLRLGGFSPRAVVVEAAHPAMRDYAGSAIRPWLQ